MSLAGIFFIKKSSTPTPTDNLDVTITVTPGHIRYGGSAFWGEAWGFGHGNNEVSDGDSTSEEEVDYGTPSDTTHISAFAKSILGTSPVGVAAGFTSESLSGKYAGVSINNGTMFWCDTPITTTDAKGYGGTTTKANALWKQSELYDLVPTDAEYTLHIITADTLPTE